MKSVPMRWALSRRLVRFDGFDLNIDVGRRGHLTSGVLFAPVAGGFSLHFFKSVFAHIMSRLFNSFRRSAEIYLSASSRFSQGAGDGELFPLCGGGVLNVSLLLLGNEVFIVLMKRRASSFWERCFLDGSIFAWYFELLLFLFLRHKYNGFFVLHSRGLFARLVFPSVCSVLETEHFFRQYWRRFQSFDIPQSFRLFPRVSLALFFSACEIVMSRKRNRPLVRSYNTAIAHPHF